MQIRSIAICLFRNGSRILVMEGQDSSNGRFYYRPLGGEIEPGESSAQALMREMREELNATVAGLRLVHVIENLFAVEGVCGHQIVFVYDGHFTDSRLYENECLMFREGAGPERTAVWKELSEFDFRHRLVPAGLLDLIVNRSSDPFLSSGF